MFNVLTLNAGRYDTYSRSLFLQSEAGVREFHIAQVSSSSKQWRLHKCINPAEDKGLSLFAFRSPLRRDYK